MKTYVAAYLCSNCKQELTKNQVLHSDGVCPLCGFVTPGAVCDTEKVSRETTSQPQPNQP